jgi:hypothetical protein
MQITATIMIIEIIAVKITKVELFGFMVPCSSDDNNE